MHCATIQLSHSSRIYIPSEQVAFIEWKIAAITRESIELITIDCELQSIESSPRPAAITKKAKLSITVHEG